MGGETTVRRWGDKVLVSACGLVVVLVGVVWGVTWNVTAGDVQRVEAAGHKAREGNKAEIEKVRVIQGYQGERIRALEESRDAIDDRLDRIDRRQGEMNTKLDDILKEIRR